ncbi:hypothetical protein DFP72DRAFT_893228 [Ephemerocybe angulata]|uniref:Uncharacterized protein n=1 Tax=Ephemerocybe angulata TaxID=980116 RepID=A0A8H6I0S3_9AGAR|nr:hypothetical protein DFP72DRAFT_893228 [Tulosesus angulatus]
MELPTANALPEEVWRAIAREIADYYLQRPWETSRKTEYLIGSRISSRKVAQEQEDRGWNIPLLPQKYMGINRHFFNYYLDAMYGEVRWTKLDQRMVTQLERLQSPIIASHVRRLQIRAWFVDYLMKRDEAGAPQAGLLPAIRNLQSRILSSLSMSVKAKGDKKLPFPTQEAEYARSFAEGRLVTAISSQTLLRLMISAVHNMRGVVGYLFEQRDLSLTKQTERFIAMASRSLGPGLRKLSLHATIFKCKPIFDLTEFKHLEELELHFDYHCHSAESQVAEAIEASKQREVETLQSTIVPFINSRKSVLRSLTLASYSHVDLSPFFRALGPFPALRMLSLNICLDEVHLSDVGVLVEFIYIHRWTLSHLDIRPRTPDSSGSDFVSTARLAELRSASWIRLQKGLFERSDIFVSLDGLHLPVGDFDSCIRLIHRTSSSLTHLSLTDRYFNDANEIKRLLGIFSSRTFQLQSLWLEVPAPTVETLKLLASRLPGLNSLVLLFECNYNGGAFLENMAMVLRGQIDWNVQHITIVARKNMQVSPEDAAVLGIVTSGPDTSTACMDAVAKVVPSVKSYKGVHWHRRVFSH